MAREIKFRVWNHNTKRYESKGYLTSSCENKRNYVLCGIMEFEQEDEDFNDDGMCVVFEQFTGFKDFDGKEIYEGDILEYVGTRSEGKRYKDLIEFDVECGGWYGKRTANTLSDIMFEQHNDEWKKRQNYLINENQRVKIVGNSFETPELIKQ